MIHINVGLYVLSTHYLLCQLQGGMLSFRRVPHTSWGKISNAIGDGTARGGWPIAQVMRHCENLSLTFPPRLSDKGKYENMVINNSVSVRGDRRSWKDCMYVQIPCKGSFRPQWLLLSFIKILKSKYRSKNSKITFQDTVQKVLRYHNQQEAHKL